jgi:hypothetical protein
MSVFFSPEEILETIRMIQLENLDIRTVTIGVSLIDCLDSKVSSFCKKIKRKMISRLKGFTEKVSEIEQEFGIPIVNKRLSVTPIATVFNGKKNDFLQIAQALEEIATELNVDFIGGFSALVHKGISPADEALILSLPEALSQNEKVCSSLNVATTRSGINVDAIIKASKALKKVAELSASEDGKACCKFVIFSNAPEDNPFMAGSFHGHGEGDFALNVGVSGPGVVRSVLSRVDEQSDLGKVSEEIKRTAFKITRMGELVGREAAKRLNISFGVVDLSLAPTPLPGDSIAEVLELIGVDRAGAPGTTAALMLLIDAVKKGGLMASSYVGGLSGTFIPVSEDASMAKAVEEKALTLPKLEAMTSICSVGLDMIAIPGNTPLETIAGIIADEMAIGVINNKTTAVRIIPVPGKKAGEMAHFGGLLGSTPIMEISNYSCKKLIKRGGRIPAPLISLRS